MVINWVETTDECFFWCNMKQHQAKKGIELGLCKMCDGTKHQNYDSIDNKNKEKKDERWFELMSNTYVQVDQMSIICLDNYVAHAMI